MIVPQFNFIPSIPKPVLYFFGVLLVSTYSFYLGYSKGVNSSNHKLEVQRLNEQLQLQKTQLETLDDILQQKEKELYESEQSAKIVTKYKTKQVIIEKDKPVYETRIKEIFVDRPTEYVDPKLVRLHDDFVCSNQTDSNESSCRTDGTTEEPVTTEQFVKTVIDNYQTAVDNQNKLDAIQQQIKLQQEVTQ